MTNELELAARVAEVPSPPRWPAAPRARVGALGLLLASVVLPDFPGILQLRSGLLRLLAPLGLSTGTLFAGETAALGVGATALAALLLAYAFRIRATLRPPAQRAADLVAVLGALFVLDYLVLGRTATDAWPTFAAFGLFFVCVGALSEPECRRLVVVVAIAVAIQCAGATLDWVAGRGRFYTPSFGLRASGTFDSPNALYVLAGVGAVVAYRLGDRDLSKWTRRLYRSAAAICLVALVLTFSRAGSVAIAIVAFAGLAGRRYPGSGRAKLALGALCVLLAVGSVTARSFGRIAAVAKDRSILGRTEIWKVSLDVVESSPWIGHGAGSYEAQQRGNMNPALRSYNPLNDEAKSLYLTFAAELGLLGLAVLVGAGGAFFRLARERPSVSGSIAESAGLFVGLSGLVDTPVLHVGRWPATFVLAVCLAWAVVSSKHASAEPPGKPSDPGGAETNAAE